MEQQQQKDYGFGTFKKILSSMPMTKPLAAVIQFFESCGITLDQLKRMASGSATSKELDATITPMIFKTQAALKNALQHLEEEHGLGTGGAYFLVKNVDTGDGNIEPYVFLCTENEEGQNEVFHYFQYFRTASYILETIDAQKKKLAMSETDIEDAESEPINRLPA